MATPNGGEAAPAPPGVPQSSQAGFVPLVCVVDFHHARGPEVEMWFGVPEGSDPTVENDWSLLPFMALSDGAHAATEDFSYFTLLRPAREAGEGGDAVPATSLFGISCTRQMDASLLLNRPADVTRSTVQKAVVVIADTPQNFGMLRERLSAVTSAWFALREFTDVEILRRFQESLADEKRRGGGGGGGGGNQGGDQYLGMSLRELVHEFRWQTLVLLKCCLLQPKMLFFGSRCERLCMMQFSLISLIPGLLRNLQDSASPELDGYEKRLTTPTSLRTSDRGSLLAYMGLPLQVFGKGSLFGPYTPLQQLDILADFGTKSYIVGSTNSLLLQQRDRYSDILINLDEMSINITSTSLRTALQLSTADRRWIDFVTQEVNDTWNESDPSRPKTMGYRGSEEFIRMQFEEYLLSLVSSVKYHNYLVKSGHNPKMMLPDIEGDPSHDFGADFVDAWALTENYRLWSTHTEPHLFDVVQPKHPCAGGLTIEDVQRRIAQQVKDLHLDERVAVGREVLGRNLAAASGKASTIFNKLYADMEAVRESQRRRAEDAKARQQQDSREGSGTDDKSTADGSKSQIQSVGNRVGAYASSWYSWGGEKAKAAGWGRRLGSSKDKSRSSGGFGGSETSSERDPSLSSRMSVSSAMTATSTGAGGTASTRPLTQSSFSESILLDGASGASSSSAPGSPREGRPIARPLSGESVTLGKDGARTLDSVIVEAGAVPTVAAASHAATNGSAPVVAAPKPDEKKEAESTIRVVQEDATPKTPTRPSTETSSQSRSVSSSITSSPVGTKVMLRP